MRKAFTAFVVGMQLLTMHSASAAPSMYVADAGCRLASTNDASGQVIQDPNTQTGTIDFGPVAVVPTDGSTVSSVTLTCGVQVNDDSHPGGSDPDLCCYWVDGVWVCHPCPIEDSVDSGATRSSTTAGNVGILADTITYTAVPGDDVYVCTTIAWDSSTGHHEVAYDADADDPTTGYVGKPGNQCELAIGVEA